MAGYYIPLVGTPKIVDSGGGGGGAGGLLVNVTDQGGTSVCDKTAGEILAVVEAGGSVVFKMTGPDGPQYYKALRNTTIVGGEEYRFDDYYAASADDYPAAGGD